MGGDAGRAGPARPARRHDRRAARRPGGPGRGDRGRAGHRGRRAAGGGARGIAGPAQPGDRPGAGGRAGGELPVPRDRLRVRPGHGPGGVLPQGLAFHHRAGRGHHPPRRGRVPGLRGRARPGHRGGPAGRHHGDRGGPGPLCRRAGGRRRRLRPADPAGQDAVLRGQVLPHLHPGGSLADPGGRRRPGPAGLAAADAVGQRAGAAGQHRGGGHDRPAGAGADPAVPVPADGPRRPAADRHARRHRAEGAGQDRRDWSPGCCRPPPGGSCSSAGRRPTPATCATATSSPRRSPRPTAGSTSAPSTTRLSGSCHDHATKSCRCRSRPTSCCWTPPVPGPTASPRSGSRTRPITPAAWPGPTPSWRAR